MDGDGHARAKGADAEIAADVGRLSRRAPSLITKCPRHVAPGQALRSSKVSTNRQAGHDS
jgi:hypothetical protein